MNSQIRSKLNKLIQNWPRGSIAVQSWLKSQGIYRQLADSYCQNQWLLRIDHGAYQLAGDNIDWPGAIYALQHQLALKVHIGAITALEMNFASHYVPLGERPKFLFINAQENRKIPRWFQHHFSKENKFSIIQTKLFIGEWNQGLQELNMGNFSITISSIERAIIECLHLAPKYIDLQHCYDIMEKLRTMRPTLLQQLLENCQSIKAKRLFLYLAELQNQPWFKQLNTGTINLGRGSRKIGEGGKYIAKYKISIPDIEKHEGYQNNDVKI